MKLLLAVLLVACAAAPVASADVTVRAEGPSGTLVDKAVPRTGDAVTKAGATCDGDSAAGALDRAVGAANWDANNFGGSDPLFVSRLFGVTLEFGSGNDRYWAFDHNLTFSDSGICAYHPQEGDELLFFAACGGPAATQCFDGDLPPLSVSAPSQVTSGTPFTVTVRAGGAPLEGATVSGADQPATTGADGTAQVTVTGVKTVSLRAEKGKQVPDETAVEAIEYVVPTPTPGVTVTPDTTAPRSTILGIRDHRVFRNRRSAPRTLRAKVVEANGIRSVTIGIARRVGKRCTAYNDNQARFTKVRCGRVPRFSVGATSKVSLLLPKRLSGGVYTLDVRATDAAGNAERTARGRNRVVFRVK